MLPFRPLPFPNEYITSYIYRLARKNSRSINSFLTTSEIKDIIYGNVQRLCEVTGFEKNFLLDMTTMKYVHEEMRNDKSIHKYIDNIFDINTIKVCPECLTDKWYYRIQWKVKGCASPV